MSIIFKKELHLIGINILVKPLAEEKTSGGIVIPQTSEDKKVLVKGLVVRKGPGWLIPDLLESKESIFSEENKKVSTKHIEMDIEENDIVCYDREASAFVRYEGHDLVLIPYHAIRFFVRENDIKSEIDKLIS